MHCASEESHDTAQLGNDLDTDQVLGRLYRDEMAAHPAVGEHPSEDAWVALATGTIEATARDRLVDHVVGCAECAAVFRGLAELQRESSGIDPQVPALPFAASPWWSRASLLAAAALAIIVVGGAAVAFRASRDSDAPPAAEAVVTPPLATSVAPTTRPSPHVAAWAGSVVALGVRMPAELSLTLRGDSSQRDFVSSLGRALDTYRAGEYASAADALTPLALAHGEVPEVAFYAGLSRLLAGQPADALALLEASTASTLVGDDARWHVAVALERLGEHERALATLRNLCARSGPRAADACRVSTPVSR